MSGDHFERMAEDYVTARPPYPDELFDRLGLVGVIGPGHRLLEIGAGTGQATSALVARGCHVTAVEPGAELAARLRERQPAARVLVGRAEDVQLPPAGFDTVVGATSLHWVDLGVALPRFHRALVPGGWLAVWRTIFGDPRVRTPFRDCVDEVVTRRSGRGCSAAERLDPRPRVDELVAGGWFEPVETWELSWHMDLDAAQVERLFASFSDWIPAEVAEVTRAAREVGGPIREHYVTRMHLLRRT